MNQDLFPELTPPPGGLNRLLNRIDESANRGRMFGWLPTAALATAAVAVALLVARPRPQTMEGILAESRDLVVFKYGYKPLPDERVQLLDMENVNIVPGKGGFEVRRR